nr:hypothetical protein [Tanacetum cinerariifolium]
MDDSLEMAATTATSLDIEQDRGGGPKCQEAIWDAVAQTRSERVSKISNDPLLTGVNTPQSGEDSLKLNELMKLCTKLQQRVLDLETTKNTQAMEIESLKRRVKKLERRKSTHDEQMFNANQYLGSEEVFVAQQDEKVVEKVVDAAQIQVTTAATTPTISIDE